MKKIYKIILLLIPFGLCPGINCFAQTYHPFPASTATWTYQYYDDVWHQPTGNFDYIIMSGDSTYNGQTYKRLSGMGGGLIRESNKRIYFLYADSLEYLLYDFNLNTGDTIFNIFNPLSWCDLDTLILYGIDSVLCTDGYHKKYYYGFSDIVEGIGGLIGGASPLITPSYCVTVSGDWRLESFADSTGTIIYPQTVGIINNYLRITTCQFIPNPLTNQSKLTFKNPNKEKFLFTLYDITGRITETVSTTNNEIILTKGSKQPGVYLFNLMNEKTGEKWNGKIIITD